MFIKDIFMQRVLGTFFSFAVLSLFLCPSAHSARIVDSVLSQDELISIDKITMKSAGGVPVGTIIVWPVEKNPEESEKWLDCDGKPIPSPSDYDKLRLLVGNNTPDFTGLFLRGRGSRSYSQNNGSTVGVTSTNHVAGALGQVQGDATRRVAGRTGGFEAGDGHSWGEGAFVGDGRSGAGSGDGKDSNIQNVYNFDSSRVTPTATENRPINMAVRYLIRALP